VNLAVRNRLFNVSNFLKKHTQIKKLNYQADKTIGRYQNDSMWPQATVFDVTAKLQAVV